MVVLVIVALMVLAVYTFSQTMLTERRATKSFTRQGQARMLAESGIDAARMFFTQDADTMLQNGGVYNNPDFQGKVVVDSDTPQNRGSFSLIAATIASCGDDFYVWSGNDDDTVPMMSIGAKGVISVLANIVPEAVAEMTKHCLDGDFKSAAKIHLKYLDLVSKLFIEVNPMPVKAAMNLMGMDVGEPRMPLCDMAPENLEKLRKSMAAVGLLQL